MMGYASIRIKLFLSSTDRCQFIESSSHHNVKYHKEHGKQLSSCDLRRFRDALRARKYRRQLKEGSSGYAELQTEPGTVKVNTGDSK